MSAIQNRGRFITLEGGEGVGKSTNLAVICELLKARHIPVLLTREPGGTALGERLRELILGQGDAAPDAIAELLMVFAARAQHIAKVIEPALAAGTWVLSDRFTDATYAYQGAGRGLDTEFIAALEDLVQGSLRPDLTVLLDVDPTVGLARARERGSLDRIEQEDLAFFTRVRQGYLDRAVAATDHWLVVDAGASLEAVGASLKQGLETWLDDNGVV